MKVGEGLVYGDLRSGDQRTVMRSNALGDRLLFWSIVVVVLISTVGIVRVALGVEERHQRLAASLLEKDQLLFRSKLDALVFRVSEDLRHEAEVIAGCDSCVLELHVARWRPLLMTNYAIQGIRLADEHGNETALLRRNKDLLIQRTTLGSKGHPVIRSMLGGPGITEADPAVDSTSSYDPRAQLWFSRALENRRDEPVWALRNGPHGETQGLHASFLIRSRDTDGAFRVLCFEYDPVRSTRLMERIFEGEHLRTMILSGNGAPLVTGAAGSDPEGTQALAAAHSRWMQKNQRRVFAFRQGDRQHHAVIVPYLLNGETLHTGVLIMDEELVQWTSAERDLLIASGVVLLLLSTLMLWLYLRHLRGRRDARKQEQRSLSQERRLAKAIGEREVLDREVHHRVKNNLQVMSSLLNLQTTRMKEGALKEEFVRSKRRIDFMALVHHKLYGMQDLRGIDMQLFFVQLANSLAAMYEPKSRTISTDIDTGRIRSDPDTAIEVGMILCELVANCYQHAFPYATGGHIQIGLEHLERDLFRLVVKDNGVGLRQLDDDGSVRLGLEVVEALSDQLDGSLKVDSNGGVVFEVRFRMGLRSDSLAYGNTDRLEQPAAGL